MPDITMCFGKDKKTDQECPLKDTCWRYTAKPSEYRQSYFTEAPFFDKPDSTVCGYYWKITDENR